MHSVHSLLRERWSNLRATSPVLAAVMTLISGMLGAQVIAFVLQIFIARVYSDVDKGLFGIYGSITGFVVTFAAMRFDLTIVLPDEDRVARVLWRLSRRCVVVSAFATSAACFVGARLLRDSYHQSDVLMWCLMASGVTVFLLAQIAVDQYWLIRKERFGRLAQNQVIQTMAITCGQLLFGLLLHGGLPAIMLGTIAGQGITLALLEHAIPEAHQRDDDAPRMRGVMRRYWRMPLVNGPNAIVDAVRLNGINLAIGAMSVAALGQFQQAWYVMQVPVGLITGSISQVFLKKLADTPPGGMSSLVRRVLVRAFLAALIPFTVLYACAPWLFPFVFGERWTDSGLYARALAPWLFMTVLTSPISNLFVVAERQVRLLVFAVLYCVVPLCWLFLSPYGTNGTIMGLGALMAGLLGGMVLMALLTARSYDRGVPVQVTTDRT